MHDKQNANKQLTYCDTTKHFYGIFQLLNKGNVKLWLLVFFRVCWSSESSVISYIFINKIQTIHFLHAD